MIVSQQEHNEHTDEKLARRLPSMLFEICVKPWVISENSLKIQTYYAII